MASHGNSATFSLGSRQVKRLGYGAMQLAGPGVFGPPRDRHVALTVLREAILLGVNHIDTSDFTAHMLRTKSFEKRCIRILTIWRSSPKLAHVAGKMRRGCPLSRLRN